MDFMDLPEGPLRLENLVTPGEAGLEPAVLELGQGGPVLDMGGRIVLPCGVDMHTHLDKGHIWPRAANLDGSFMGALNTVAADRSANWSAEDVRTRMDFSLRCAWAHGTRAIRTHLDSLAPQDRISWPVFAELREAWAGRIELQAANLVPIDIVEDAGDFRATADMVAEHGGVLGAVAFPVPDLDRRLDTFFAMAAERGLEADFHVDETLDPGSAALRAIAEAKIRTGYDSAVVAGHCCSLSTQGEAEALRTLDLVAEAGIAVVSLPMCNLYLQDRHAGRTPRHRGVTLVHEMAERGIPVAFASDNTRDPFYAYGDLDLMEVLRMATRIAHLDHSRDDWHATIAATPEAVCAFAPADQGDAIILNARSWTEAFSRPQSDRIVLRAGRPIDRTLPEYSELDHLMEP